MQRPDHAQEEEVDLSSSARTLRLALRASGNATSLANTLGVSVQQLAIWIAGEDMPPPKVFATALDLAFPKRDNGK